MVEMRPSVELVTLPENRAENFCSKRQRTGAADGVVDQPASAGIRGDRRIRCRFETDRAAEDLREVAPLLVAGRREDRPPAVVADDRLRHGRGDGDRLAGPRNADDEALPADHDAITGLQAETLGERGAQNRLTAGSFVVSAQRHRGAVDRP